MHEHRGKRILVTASEPEAAELYYDIARHAMTDLGLARTITAALFHIDIDAPLYAAAVRTRPTLKPTTLGQIAALDLDERNRTLRVTIRVERYAPQTLTALQRVFGEERVHQRERLDLEIDLPENFTEEHLERLQDLVVHDPRERLTQRVYDLIQRVRPEGFRVARHAQLANDYLYAATEGRFREEWSELLMELPGELNRLEGTER